MKPLKAAQDAIAAKNWDEAMVHIQEAQAVEPKTPYDSFMIDEFSWYVLLQKKDYAGASGRARAAVNSGFVPPADLPQRLKALAQLNYKAENYPKAAEYRQSIPGDRTRATATSAYWWRRATTSQKDYAGARAAVAEADRRRGQAERTVAADQPALQLRAEGPARHDAGHSRP